MSSRDGEHRTYKTVAMPSAIRGGRKLGASRAERVAMAMSEIINREAEGGWSYIGSDTIRTQERQGLFGGMSEAVYTILVFERPAQRRVEPSLETPGEERVRARRAADAAAMRERRRSSGYGFDEELTADRSDDMERRPLRRREARMAARRTADDDPKAEGSPNGRGSRGLVETMRQHRDRG